MTGEIAFIVAQKQGGAVVPSQAVVVSEVAVTARSGEGATTTPAAPGTGSAGSANSASVPVRPGVVWVVRDGRLLCRTVTVGLRSIERTEILDGLEAGDRVVISPAEGLTAGREVKVKYLDPIEAAAANRPVEQKAMKGFN